MDGAAQTAEETATTDKVVWAPLPGSQTLFLTCPYFEAIFEGTRGPGKTDALLMSYAQHVGEGHGPAWRGALFRREYKDLADIVARSKRWFYPMFPGARFLESPADYKWIFPDGEQFLFRFAKKAGDYWTWHGQELPFQAYDELCAWPDLDFYDLMKTCCRSSTPGVPKMYRATANPYGPGHNAVKAYIIDPAPPGQPITDDAGRERVRIRGNIWENRHLLENDPDYVKTLLGLKDENKRKAWILGDWDIVAGGMFDDLWDQRYHVLDPFDIPHSWRIDRSFDWGSSKPFSVGWWAESDGSDYQDAEGQWRSSQRGDLFRIAEWYGWSGEPNTGVTMLAQNIANGVKEREDEMGRYVQAGPADSQIFDTQEGTSIADRMATIGIGWEKADKSPGSRKIGWDKMRERLSNAVTRDGPGLFVFSTCRNFIRTVPVLPRDEKDMDDADTEAEDHIADETRYRIHNPPQPAQIGKLKGH